MSNGGIELERDMERDEYGVWTVEIYDNVNGDSAIPHNSMVKFSFKNSNNEEVKLDPAWIKSSTSAAPYDGIYWDPPDTERNPRHRIFTRLMLGCVVLNHE